MSAGLDKVKRFLMDKENVIILVLSVLLSVLLYRLYSLNKESYTQLKRKERFQSGEFMVVLFFAPWCGHCTKLMPQWDSLGSTISLENGGSCEVKKEDCAANPDSPKKYGVDVEGFPHISLFKDGKELETYSGPRTSNSIKSWVDKLLGGL